MKKSRSGLRPRVLSRRLTPAATLLAAMSLVLSAHAANIYWDGTSAGWDSTANWSTASGADTPDPVAVPGIGDDAIFNISTVNAAAVVSLNGARSANALVFNNTGATTLQGGGVNQVLTLGAGGITAGAGAGSVTIGSATAGQNVAITLNATQSWINNSANTVSVFNNVTGLAATTQTLTVGGSGNTTLSGLLDDGATNGVLNLTKTGSGYLRLGGAATNLAGVVDIQGGTVGTTQDFTAAGLTGTGTFENGTALDKWSFWNITTNQTFNGVIRNGDGTLGLLGLNKNGNATWTLTNNANNATSALNVNAGRLILNGTGTYGSTGQAGAVRIGVMVIGNTAAANGVLEINGATVNYNNRSATGTEPYRGTLAIGNNGTGAGALQLSSGTLSLDRQLGVGVANGSFGAYTQTGGTATVGGFLAIGLGTAKGVFNLSGGTYTNSAGPVTNGAGAGGVGVMNIGGNAIYNQNGAGDSGIWVGENGTGTINVSGTAAVNIAVGNNGLQLGRGATGVGVANLLGGTVTTPAVTKGTGSGVLNFNGGALVANTPGATFLTGLTAAYVNSGGGTIGNGGNNITVGQALLAPTGNGVSSTGLTASGGGYIATPVVTITGGGGTGATAVATIDASGNLTGISITNPGVGYTSAPTFALAGGGIGNTGALGGAASLVANTSGGMTFTGAGVTTLSGVNTYTGATTVASGTLALDATGTLASASLVVANGAEFDVSAKSAFDFGTVSTTVQLGASTAGFFDAGAAALTFGGGLTLNFVTGALADGQTYNLFDFGSQTGDLASVTLSGSFGGSLVLAGQTWTGSAGGYGFSLNEADGVLTVSAVPEPSSYAALAGVLGLGFAALRRRRRQA